MSHQPAVDAHAQRVPADVQALHRLLEDLDGPR